jgi:hypothetical protein
VGLDEESLDGPLVYDIRGRGIPSHRLDGICVE